MVAREFLLCCVSGMALVSGSTAASAEKGPVSVQGAAADSGVTDQALAPKEPNVAGAKAQEQSSADILVTARRQEEQRDTKRNSLQVVDAVGRTAIDDNPARSVADLIRQIPAINIENDQGEPRNPRIRGLGFVQTTIDGREVLMAGQRNVDVGDVAVDLLDGIEVYKTPSADMVEGGLAGLINLKLRKPLSFKGFHGTALVTGIYDEHSKKTSPSGDLVIGDVWDTGIGRIGVSVGIGAITNDFRNDFAPVGDYRTTRTAFDLNRNGVLGEAADAVTAPGYFGGRYMQGHRERYIGNVQVQWQPSDKVDVHGSYFGLIYRDSHYHYVLNMSAPTANSLPAAQQFTLVPGTTDRIATGSYANASVNTQGFYAPTRRYLQQGSAGIDWQASERVKASLNGDYTYARATSDLEILTTTATAPRLDVTTIGADVRYGLVGLDVTNPASFRVRDLFENRSRQYSKQYAQRLDVDYEVGEGLLRHLQVGARLTQRTASQVGGGRTSTPRSTATAPIADQFGLSWSGFLSKDDFTPARWAAFDPYRLTDFAGLRALLGTPTSAPPYDRSQDFRFDEKTYAAYARALYGFTLAGIEADGDFGVRVVGTHTVARGFVTAGGSATPTTSSSDYTNWLPSATLRLKLTDKVNLRFSGSGTVTRPAFGDLAPGITLDLANNLGSAGNPALRAYTSKGADATLEWYHSPAGFVYTALFYKKLDGFIQSNVSTESFNGSPYRISRPVNGGTAVVKGIEVGGNERFVFLPGVLRNLGIDANFTYVDASQSPPSPVSGTAFLDASKYTYNVSGYFEYAGLSARVNYSNRSHFLINQDPPISFTSQDWMDVSLRLRVNQHLELLGNATNILTPLRHSYVGSEYYPDSVSRPLRRFEIGARARF